MKRGRTERETCDLNGWRVGTVLRGYEPWDNGKGMWSTIRITAIGESGILAVCTRHERTDGARITQDSACRHGETSWTLSQRDWRVTSPADPNPVHAGATRDNHSRRQA